MLRTSILLSVIYFTLLSCSTNQDKKSTDTAEQKSSKDKTLEVKFTSSKKNDNLTIKNIELSSEKKVDDISGITVSLDLEIKPEAFNYIKSESYSGFFIDLKTILPGNKTLLYRDELFKDQDKKKFININRDNFISSFGGRTIEIFIPFRQMEMKGGTYNLKMEIAAFPVKYEDDNTSLNMRLMKNIAAEPIVSSQFEFEVTTPKLYQTSFTVYKSKIDSKLKDPSKYDVALSGKGYPDLFWEVFCGNDYIYYSPVEKNQLEYTQKYSSPQFYSSGEDIIHLAMIDYDNGPFNTQDDVIGMKEFKTQDLKNKIDTLQFGKLEYFILQTQIEEIK